MLESAVSAFILRPGTTQGKSWTTLFIDFALLRKRELKMASETLKRGSK